MSLGSAALKSSDTAALAMLGDKVATTQLLVFIIFFLLGLVCVLLIWTLKSEAKRHREKTQEMIDSCKLKLSTDLINHKETIETKIGAHREEIETKARANNEKIGAAFKSVDNECKEKYDILQDVKTRQETHKERIDKIESKQDSHEKLIAKDLENFELKLQTLSTQVSKITSTLEAMAQNINGTSIMVARIAEHLHIEVTDKRD